MVIRDKDQFRIDEPRVISETLDGEMILVHFETGCYFSLRSTAADVCQLLAAGWTIEDTIKRLAAQHHSHETRIGGEIRAFVTRLVEEKLLVPAPGAPRRDADLKLSAGQYAPPVLEKFDDMADQLLLDPIHEIDESGWPARRAG